MGTFSTLGHALAQSLQGVPPDPLREASNKVGTTDTHRWVMPGKVRIFLEKDGFASVDDTYEFSSDQKTYRKVLSKK